MQTGKTLSDPNRFKFDGDGYYLKSAAEMRQIWDAEVPGACDSTLLIAERVQSYAEVWTPRDRMPVFPVPEGHDQASWLHHEVMAGLRRRFPDGVGQDYIDRAEYEIKVICDKGFPSYFLIVADLINYARSVDIRVGPGRGSAAGSWWPTRWASPTSTRFRTACCSSGSSTRSGRRRPTSTSTSTTVAAARWCATPPTSGA